MNTPLVSVVVITYNSSKYVLETLESAKAQTYQNIELVVSDDCSTDNTVELCRNWIEQNKARFVRTELILSEKNTGISANCNRGYKAAQGEWIKGIAGDDILMDECIEKYIEYLRNNPCDLVYARLMTFGSLCSSAIQNYIDSDWYRLQTIYNDSVAKCCKLTVYRNLFPAPSLLLNKKIFSVIGYFDERIPFIEDWPFVIKILESNLKIEFLNYQAVGYRIEESITRTQNNFISAKFYDSLRAFYRLYLFPRYKKDKEFLRLISCKLYLLKYQLAITVFKNHRTRFNCFVLKFFTLVSPSTYLKLD